MPRLSDGAFDDALAMAVEGRCGAIERGIIEFPFRRIELQVSFALNSSLSHMPAFRSDQIG
jgi:hypothetical protein